MNCEIFEPNSPCLELLYFGEISLLLLIMVNLLAYETSATLSLLNLCLVPVRNSLQILHGRLVTISGLIWLPQTLRCIRFIYSQLKGVESLTSMISSGYIKLAGSQL